jgi:hypothetical protein
MDSLHDILGNKNFDEPPEAASIKKYVRDTFQAEVSVQLKERDIIIIVPNAALASMLRLRSPEIRRRCQLAEKRLSFRIG